MRHLKTSISLLILINSISFIANGQENNFKNLSFLFGEWNGTGEGFGNSTSVIESSFKLVMDGKYIEVSNESWFKPTDKNPEGEHHLDKGFISYDNKRKSLVFRQFNNEGYVNQYLLNDSLSGDSVFVFETESIENFVTGGKARWTIKKLSENQLETIFEVSFPNKDYSCFGINRLYKKETIMENKEPKVTGVGGIFFFSDDPQKTKEWYSDNLGIETDEYGSSFESRDVNNPDEINYLQWTPFKKGSEYFAPSKKEFMINYRVQNIEQLVKNLKENGVTVVDDIETYEYGKFVHIMDPEGNKIELWEP